MAGFNVVSGSEFLLNTGGGNFSNITDSSGIRGLRAFTAAALDYDGDGWVDFVSGSNPRLSADRPSGVSLMRNNGDHTFTDVTAMTCLDPATQLINGGQILVFDFDDDADSDLLFVSIFGISLYQNNGDGTFSDITVKAGLTPFRRNKEGCAAASGRARRKSAIRSASMGGAVGDYDNDGHIDIFLTGRRGEDRLLQHPLPKRRGRGLHRRHRGIRRPRHGRHQRNPLGQRFFRLRQRRRSGSLRNQRKPHRDRAPTRSTKTLAMERLPG